jgi:arylsulfatase
MRVFWPSISASKSLKICLAQATWVLNEPSQVPVHSSVTNRTFPSAAAAAVVLEFLKANGLDEKTIVCYSTDNGPEHSSWPHGATTPFRSEEMTTYEGGVRVIFLLRWPGVIKPGQILDGIQAHQDMFTSFAADAGVTNVAEQIAKEKKQYIDGVNDLDWWTGKSADSARHHFLYDYESDITAVRMGPWKIHMATREDDYDTVTKRVLFFNLRSDRFESYDTKDSAGHMMQRMSWLFEPHGSVPGGPLTGPITAALGVSPLFVR